MCAEARSSAGFGGGVPAGKTYILGQQEVIADHGLLKGCTAGEYIAKSGPGPHAQRLMNAGTPHVGVDQQNPAALLRQHHRC